MGNVTQNDKKFNPAEHLMQLKGKDYLQVMWRLVWFREEHPNWGIETTALSVDEKGALFASKIYDENGNLVSSGHGSETPKDFGDYIEKAETKAVGRALAMLGYGTQFAPELDEGERIVDSPVPKKKSEPKPDPLDKLIICDICGAVIKPFKDSAGKITPPEEWKEKSIKSLGKCVCNKCIREGRHIGNEEE